MKGRRRYMENLKKEKLPRDEVQEYVSNVLSVTVHEEHKLKEYDNLSESAKKEILKMICLHSIKNSFAQCFYREKHGVYLPTVKDLTLDGNVFFKKRRMAEVFTDISFREKKESDFYFYVVKHSPQNTKFIGEILAKSAGKFSFDTEDLSFDIWDYYQSLGGSEYFQKIKVGSEMPNLVNLSRLLVSIDNSVYGMKNVKDKAFKDLAMVLSQIDTKLMKNFCKEVADNMTEKYMTFSSHDRGFIKLLLEVSYALPENSPESNDLDSVYQHFIEGIACLLEADQVKVIKNILAIVEKGKDVLGGSQKHNFFKLKLRPYLNQLRSYDNLEDRYITYRSDYETNKDLIDNKNQQKVKYSPINFFKFESPKRVSFKLDPEAIFMGAILREFEVSPERLIKNNQKTGSDKVSLSYQLFHEKNLVIPLVNNFFDVGKGNHYDDEPKLEDGVWTCLEKNVKFIVKTLNEKSLEYFAISKVEKFGQTMSFECQINSEDDFWFVREVTAYILKENINTEESYEKLVMPFISDYEMRDDLKKEWKTEFYNEGLAKHLIKSRKF